MSNEEFDAIDRETAEESQEMTKIRQSIEDSGTKTIGDFLSYTRKKMGLSLEDVDRISRIGPRWIDAIEAGEWSLYPSLIYAKGHIKGYATVLGLDGGLVIDNFRTELVQAFPDENFHIHPVQNINQIYQPTAQRKEHTAGTRIIFMVVLAVLFLIFVVSRLLHSHGGQRTSMVPSPVSNAGILTPENHPGAKTIPPGSTTLGTPNQNGQPSSSSPVSPSAPLGTITTPSIDTPSTNTQSGAVPKSPVPNKVKPTRPVDYVLKVVALRDTWIGISTDGKKNVNIPLDKGQWRVFHGKKNFRVSTDDGGSLMLYLDKNQLGKAGEDDQPVRQRLINLTPDKTSTH
ncbi:MAG: helix-turn-helix domain-containing protein [Leptospirales bacterium]